MDNQRLESRVRKRETIGPKQRRNRVRQDQSTSSKRSNIFQEKDVIQWMNAAGSPPQWKTGRSSLDRKMEGQLNNDRLPTSLIDSFFSNSLFYQATSKSNDEENFEQLDLNTELQYPLETDSENGADGEASDEMSGSSDYDDKEDDVPKNCVWTPISQSKSFPFGEYTAPNHLLIPIISEVKPIDCYLKFVTNDVWELMVQETNRHGVQYYFTRNTTFHQPQQNRLASTFESVVQKTGYWVATNTEEMKKFIGIILCMGLVSYPRLQNYWAENNHIFGVPLIKASMDYERFVLLSKFFRFSNLEKLLEMISNNFQNVILPGKDLVIQHSVIPRRDKNSSKHKIRNGVMFYKLCTPEGYTLKNNIHTDDFDVNRFLVYRLLEPFLDQGRVVFVDQTSTNVQLAEELLTRKTMICGNLHRNREKTVIRTKVKPDEVVGFECQHDVSVIKWCNQFSSITILTTVPEYKTDLLLDTETVNADQSKSIPIKPKVVADYMRARRGAKLVQPSSYPKSKNGLKWYRRIVFELLIDTVVVNAWIIFTFMSKDTCSIVKFREQLVRNLLCADGIEVKKQRAHVLMCKNGVQDFNKDRKRCKGCYKKHAATMSARDAANATKKVRTFCNQCNKYYCLPCFNDAHVNM